MNLSPLFGSQTFVFLPSSLSTRPQQWVLALSPFSLFQYSRNARSKGAFGLRSDPSPLPTVSPPRLRWWDAHKTSKSQIVQREREISHQCDRVCGLVYRGISKIPVGAYVTPVSVPAFQPSQMYVRCKCELYMFRKTFTWNGIEKRVNGSSWIVLLAYLDCVFPASMLTMQT